MNRMRKNNAVWLLAKIFNIISFLKRNFENITTRVIKKLYHCISVEISKILYITIDELNQKWKPHEIYKNRNMNFNVNAARKKDEFL